MEILGLKQLFIPIKKNYATMRIIETTVYSFNELSPEAQEKAIDNCRYFDVDPGWWGHVYEQVTQAAQILGIEIYEKKDQPAIYFSGFGHQGQGSSFEGYCRYAKGCVAKIKKEFPATVLHEIAADLVAFQRSERWEATARVSTWGHQSSGISISVDCEGSDRPLKDALRRFNDWIFSELEKEYDYLTSDEQVKEMILVNEYEFTKDGSMI